MSALLCMDVRDEENNWLEYEEEETQLKLMISSQLFDLLLVETTNFLSTD